MAGDDRDTLINRAAAAQLRPAHWPELEPNARVDAGAFDLRRWTGRQLYAADLMRHQQFLTDLIAELREALVSARPARSTAHSMQSQPVTWLTSPCGVDGIEATVRRITDQ